MPHAQKAHHQYDAAFHLLHVTFPLVKDPKLLMCIIHNVFNSMNHAMDAIMTHEQQLHLVPNYSDNFQSRYNMFRLKSVQRNKIPSNLVMLIHELKELIELKKHAPTEFQRGNRYILANKDFQLKSISINDIKTYLDLNKEFLGHMDRIITKA